MLPLITGEWFRLLFVGITTLSFPGFASGTYSFTVEEYINCSPCPVSARIEISGNQVTVTNTSQIESAITSFYILKPNGAVTVTSLTSSIPDWRLETELNSAFISFSPELEYSDVDLYFGAELLSPVEYRIWRNQSGTFSFEMQGGSLDSPEWRSAELPLAFVRWQDLDCIYPSCKGAYITAAYVSINTSGDQLEIEYKGTIQESTDLVEWSDMDPQPENPWSLSVNPGEAHFYRIKETE
jgi:hypothetical protein